MTALYTQVRTKDPNWRLVGFIVDDPLYDILAIRDVFQWSVLIGFWRVRHLWHKNIVRSLEIDMQVKISKQLEWIMDNICRLQGTMSLFEDFIEDFIDESNFMDYFKATWYPRMGAWINALKTLPLASQESCAAVEFYHNQLKIRLFNEKDNSVFQRADWLVDKLGTKVHSYFWLDEYSGKDDFARYWKNEWISGLTSWRKALKIPDTDVLLEDGCAKVTDQDNPEKAYVVHNPGSMFSVCNCSWAQVGNLCEHVLKVISIYRKRGSIPPSVGFFWYQKALKNMLHCPPYDSIRDHAVSLAVSVQQQLNTLLDKESIATVMDPNEKRVVVDICLETPKVVSCNQDPKLDNKQLIINDDISRDGDDSDDGLKIADQVVDCGSNENEIPSERVREDSLLADMDVDPSSIYISPPRLCFTDENFSSNEFREKAFATKLNEVSASENGALCDDKDKERNLDKAAKNMQWMWIPQS
ncbi:hypothetical protein HN51_022239 [Arachis hypogaea]|uniref:SWIM-type domain-containing protein n=1 Tax=Arachis hypogaea TaxID=3818 RepID=A0A445EE21_ARAHY|nr:hypothetical protein Ahy_A02g007857 [Arachis hypogaea]